jgi:hypothetical protein
MIKSYNRLKAPFQSLPFHYILIIIAIIIVLVTSIVLFSTIETDDEAPILEVITKDISVYEGEIVTIEVNFSDNDKVDSAILYYKQENDETFLSKSILNKTATIAIPNGSGEDWEYYVVINDPAGNGPVGLPSTNGSKTYDIIVVKRDDGSNNTSDDTGYQKSVFIEEFSARTCKNCPDVADSLHELFETYKSSQYQFHYVTIIADHDHSDTNSRLQDYNVIAYPVVFVDGGYQTLYGRKDTLTYGNAIQTASERNVPDIKINLTASYIESNNEIKITVKCVNDEQNEYTGRIRVYLAEIISTKYQDSLGKQFNNAFLEFAINKDVTILANDEKTETKTLNGDSFDPENLMVYAVMFSKEKHETYQDVDEEINPFDAYYVDACVGVQVVEGGNLPPSISIEYPKLGKVYFLGNQIKLLDSFTFQQTFLIGRCKFTVKANDNDGIEKVELYIDGTKIDTFDSEPYEFNYRNSRILQFKHTITFTAYDSLGKTASASLDIFAITL